MIVEKEGCRCLVTAPGERMVADSSHAFNPNRIGCLPPAAPAASGAVWLISKSLIENWFGRLRLPATSWIWKNADEIANGIMVP